jgi:hypothetical protein
MVFGFWLEWMSGEMPAAGLDSSTTFFISLLMEEIPALFAILFRSRRLLEGGQVKVFIECSLDRT